MPCPLSCPSHSIAVQNQINQSHSFADCGIIKVAVLYHKIEKGDL